MALVLSAPKAAAPSSIPPLPQGTDAPSESQGSKPASKIGCLATKTVPGLPARQSDRVGEPRAQGAVDPARPCPLCEVRTSCADTKPFRDNLAAPRERNDWYLLPRRLFHLP